MSYSQRRRGSAEFAATPCRYEYWWRERQRRSDGQRGRLPAGLPAIPSNKPPAIFDPERRLIEPQQRITDIEKGLQHSHCNGRVRGAATSISLSSDSTLLEKPPPSLIELPSKRSKRFFRHLRYGTFAVYQRLFTFVFLANLAAVLILLHHQSWTMSRVFQLDHLATFASSNLLVAIFFRQDWLINLLFRTAWLVPWSAPLRIRRMISRVYCYGGIHSGAATTGTAWWLAFTAVMSWEGVTHGHHTPALLILTLTIASLLLTIILLSLPRLRARHHNTWELTHRFLGWLAVALFWAQLLLLTQHAARTGPHPFTALLARTPSFYNLAALTALLAYPWLRLRRWRFAATPLSAHALLLSTPRPVPAYSCLVLSAAPWREWHPFATFPRAGGTGLVVSGAGDWTRGLVASARWRSKEEALRSGGEKGAQTVQGEQGEQDEQLEHDKQPAQPSQPSHPAPKAPAVAMHFWVKPHPHPGVLSLTLLYPRLIILTTGSGIGPALSSLLDRPASQHARLVWSTRSPLTTYGPEILALVARADPHAVVLDTDARGRPDLLRVALGVWREERAEAVFVLSNERVTREVVGGLERRGVPAFGPIWDS
ncbi:hypothetical protein C7974DRAFT_414633 [Boeremia exigua]|uniref:uncharacterized protein n=1 Tax=Boeremia exigua TaxID=749465 RepID=UPI001E8D1E49|nr:uncharacterized protein C7974DRAFT_414633 [Boeremia exigua]KAH6621954.1 hypothetical protein C7974DRAFT_414633 [Boeremia exigua]